MTAATTQDLRAVVYLARRVRKGIGARQWSEDELMAELAQYAGYDLGTVVDFVNRGARDKGLQRPAGLHKGSHHTEPPTATPFVPLTMDSTERCSVCSFSETVCRIRHSTDDHEFESAAMAARRRAEGDPTAAATAIAALKAGIEPMEVKPVKSLAEIEAERPGFATRLAAIRATLPAPPLQEVQPEEPEEATS